MAVREDRRRKVQENRCFRVGLDCSAGCIGDYVNNHRPVMARVISGVRKGAHVWTDEERSQLIRERAAGRSWDSLAEEYGVSKAAVQIQVARARKGKK